MANKLLSELFKGTYSGVTAYTVGDIVTYNGSSYANVANSTGNLPTDTNYWALLASKGDDGSGASDGDKGDITVSGSGSVWTIDNGAVTYAKMQDVSATSRILGRVTSGAGDVEELTAANVLSILGITSSAAELNILDGVTSTAAELNILDGVTATTAEINYIDGVTSNIQTQLDGKVNDTGDTMTGSLTLASTDVGGQNTSDSTNRINLNSHQRAEGPNNFGEVMRIYGDHERSKQMLAWYKRHVNTTTTFTDAGDVWNATFHGLEDTERVVLSTTGSLPTGYSVGTVDSVGNTTGTVYYVINATEDTFQLSDTKGGSVVVGTGTGSGTHTVKIVPQLKAWVGWHYRANDVSDTLDPHNHWSIETNDSEGIIRTRLEVVADNLDTTQVNTFNANFNVIQGNIGITGVDGANKQLIFYDAGDNREKTSRWSVLANATAESGSNVGSDFQISRFNDAGSFVDVPFFIKRSTGRVGIGTTDPISKLHLEGSANENIFYLKSTHSGASTAANALFEGDNSADRMIQARVTGDTIARFNLEATGLLEWGPGGGTARDTNLYRSSANVLKTDDALEAASLSLTTDLALAHGGTGASLSDPGVDRIMAWDDSAGTVSFIALADITDEPSPASGDFLLIYGAEGDLRRVDWADLPSSGGGVSDGDKGDITVSSSGAVWNIDAGVVGVTELSATGTPSASTYLRGDNTWATIAGSGDVSKVGTPVNNQIGVWTGDGTLEGDADLTFDTATNTLAIGTGILTVDTITLTGTGTLNGVDAIDATTEATIEAAIDTLANLTSIQGRTVTLADAGADAIFGWDDSASAYQNLSAADARTALGLVIGTNVQAYDADLTTWAGITPGTGVATALAVNVGSAGAFVTLNGAGGTPSSLTLTNATGLPISGLVASTSTAIGVGSIELGHASDTTLSRNAAGVLAVEGVVVPTISSTNTLTNKTISPASNTIALKETIGFTADGGGSALTTGKIKGFRVVPYAGTITAWNITADAGTATVKVWKVATGTAKPTSSNSINTSGVGLSTGTHVRSTTLTDFTSTSVAANDIIAFEITAVSTATELAFNLEITRT